MNKERFEALNDYLHTLSGVQGKRNDEIDAVIGEIHKELNIENKAIIDSKSKTVNFQNLEVRNHDDSGYLAMTADGAVVVKGKYNWSSIEQDPVEKFFSTVAKEMKKRGLASKEDRGIIVKDSDGHAKLQAGNGQLNITVNYPKGEYNAKQMFDTISKELKRRGI